MTSAPIDAETSASQAHALPISSTTRLIVIAVIVLGVVGRFVTTSDLWLDEALSVNIARLPIGDIADWLRHDGAPPLYYWLLNIWTSVFGTSDVAVRSLSGVFALAAMPVAFACGRRVGGQRAAWIAVVLVALNPFAIRFATETRMYSLEILLVFAIILAVRRAFERPQALRLVLVSLLTAALLYTHYWCMSFVAAGMVVIVLTWWRGQGDLRTAAVRIAGAIMVGALTYVAWLPALLYQREHTGTPWATRQFPTIPIGRSLLEFAGGDHAEGWAIVYVCVALLIVGVFGHATKHGSIELDLSAHSSATPEALLGVLALLFGASLAYLSNSGFQPRYSAIALPCFVLVLARGIQVFPNPAVRTGAIVLISAVGLAGLGRNITENRTQMGDIATSISLRAEPNDVVIYCPDQLGPATHRVLQRTEVGRSLREVAYPLFSNGRGDVGLVDWVDYTERLGSVTPDEAAKRATKLAGRQSIYVVEGSGYITHDALCPSFVAALANASKRTPQYVVAANAETFEHAGYYEFRAP